MNPIEETQAWLEKVVIGLNLCPFAKAVHGKGQIRWVLSEATEPRALLEELTRELQFLATVDPQTVDTTLIVHPLVLQDFLDFNDFQDVADALLQDMGLEGELQVASFHPQFQFAGTSAHAPQPELATLITTLGGRLQREVGELADYLVVCGTGSASG